MHIAIIGGGASGLCAARHITTTFSDMTCVVYEQTDQIGGTWVYTDKVGKDQYGLPIHSSMYKNLRTNLPKENMEFLGFPWKSEQKSYLTAKEVLNYLLAYVDCYNLKKHIKFHHHVTRISPLETGWEVTACDLESKEEIVEHFDSVMVCNGHNRDPVYPDIKGLNLFKGNIIHSHNYRVPEVFTAKSVAVIGGGPSGIDITWDMSKFASKIYFTHHSPELLNVQFPSNVQHMPPVTEITENGVTYEDNKSYQVDVLMICTGYKYTFPFLTPECGISIEDDKFIQPLYKHIIYALRPSLCFLGIVFSTFLFPLFDVQIMFFLRALSGAIHLPSKKEMLEDIDTDIKQRREIGLRPKEYHKLVGTERMKLYLDNLCEIGQFQPLPNVLFRIFDHVHEDKQTDLENYRDVEYRIIDDERYTRNGVLL